MTSGCWEILNSEECLFGNLGASKGKRPLYHFSSNTVCEKEEGQSNYTQVDRSCEFHSWTLGTSNTCFFPAEFWKLQSVCAHVIPLGPAFIISYIWFSVFCHLPCHILSSQSSFFLLGISRLLVGTLGRSLFLTAGVCNGVRKMKNPVKFLRKLSQLTKREKLFSTT